MTDERATVLVVRDEAGEIYLLTDELLARARATETQQTAIEAALADVQGFTLPTATHPLATPLQVRAADQDKLGMYAAWSLFIKIGNTSWE